MFCEGLNLGDRMGSGLLEAEIGVRQIGVGLPKLRGVGVGVLELDIQLSVLRLVLLNLTD